MLLPYRHDVICEPAESSYKRLNFAPCIQTKVSHHICTCHIIFAHAALHQSRAFSGAAAALQDSQCHDELVTVVQAFLHTFQLHCGMRLPQSGRLLSGIRRRCRPPTFLPQGSSAPTSGKLFAPSCVPGPCVYVAAQKTFAQEAAPALWAPLLIKAGSVVISFNCSLKCST